MNTYRTRTYIAGDWDHYKDAVDQLHKWNDSDHWSLSFIDAHELMSARDSSLNCSIKTSLKRRMDSSKAFVLIVGEHTNNVTAGSCRWCNSYNSYTGHCARNYRVDFRSFIKYECDIAKDAGIKIIVLYKATRIDREKCPEAIRHMGKHATMYFRGNDGKLYWDYQSVKEAFDV